jgi:hypothetical protein
MTTSLLFADISRRKILQSEGNIMFTMLMKQSMHQMILLGT